MIMQKSISFVVAFVQLLLKPAQVNYVMFVKFSCGYVIYLQVIVH